MAAGVAHDFDNALTAIVSHAGLLRAQTRDPALLVHAEAILKTARVASQVVERIRSMVRPTPSRERTRVSLAALIREAREVALVRARTRGIEIGAVFGPADASAGPWVEGNPGELQQVAINLLHNAVDAATRFVAINVSLAGQIRIIDDGPGIPADLVDKVFEPFFTTRESGTGLGLYLARATVEAHGGTLRLERANPGTVAILALPTLADEDVATMAEARPLTDLELTPTNHGARVLVVDDDHATRQALHILFEASGHQVTSVSSTNEAVMAFHELRPDLVVTDLHLDAKKIGLHIDRMSSLDPRVPMIVVSGLGAGQYPPSLSRKVAAIFEKPVSPGRLLDTAKLLIAERIAFRAQRRSDT
jgi:CheY-like chemotaxis protein